MDIFMIVIIVAVVILVLGAMFMTKSVSMYKKSEEDKKYNEMLSKPLEKFEGKQAEELAKKYEEKEDK